MLPHKPTTIQTMCHLIWSGALRSPHIVDMLPGVVIVTSGAQRLPLSHPDYLFEPVLTEQYMREAHCALRNEMCAKFAREVERRDRHIATLTEHVKRLIARLRTVIRSSQSTDADDAVDEWDALSDEITACIRDGMSPAQ